MSSEKTWYQPRFRWKGSLSNRHVVVGNSMSSNTSRPMVLVTGCSRGNGRATAARSAIDGREVIAGVRDLTTRSGFRPSQVTFTRRRSMPQHPNPSRKPFVLSTSNLAAWMVSSTMPGLLMLSRLSWPLRVSGKSNMA